MPKSEVMREYYYDELLCVMDEYHSLNNPEEKDEEVFADEWEG